LWSAPHAISSFAVATPIPVDRSAGPRSDQTIVLTGLHTTHAYPVPLRRVRYYATNFSAPAQTIADIYHHRWSVELFFKWTKQHLRIKGFLGNSSNAVKTQIWIAIVVYTLTAIIKKRLGLEHSLYTILQVFSTVIFEKTPISQVFQRYDHETLIKGHPNQLSLFDI